MGQFHIHTDVFDSMHKTGARSNQTKAQHEDRKRTENPTSNWGATGKCLPLRERGNFFKGVIPRQSNMLQ